MYFKTSLTILTSSTFFFTNHFFIHKTLYIQITIFLINPLFNPHQEHRSQQSIITRKTQIDPELQAPGINALDGLDHFAALGLASTLLNLIRDSILLLHAVGS